MPRRTVGALGLVTIAAYGVAYYSYGVLIDPIHRSTGWSPAALGAIFSAVLVIGGVGGIFGGRLVDRAGTAPAFVLAGGVGGAALFLASYASSLVGFGVLYAMGCGTVAALGFYHVTQPASIRAGTGAPERAVVRLTILGAFASPIFLPLTAALVNALDWRATVRIEAAVTAGVFLASALFVRSHGTRTLSQTRTPSTIRQTLRKAWAAPGYRPWLVASLLGGAAVDVVLVYQVPIMIAAGLPAGVAAGIAGARGFAQLAGGLPLSPIMARLGARRTVILSFALAGAGTALMLTSGLLPAAIAYSVLAGASIGAIYTLQGIYTSELIGSRDLGLLLGAQQAAYGAGGAIGPLLAGLLFAALNSYVTVVLVTAAAFLLSAQILARSPARTKHRTGKASTVRRRPSE